MRMTMNLSEKARRLTKMGKNLTSTKEGIQVAREHRKKYWPSLPIG
jgi:hypothetical protein